MFEKGLETFGSKTIITFKIKKNRWDHTISNSTQKIKPNLYWVSQGRRYCPYIQWDALILQFSYDKNLFWSKHDFSDRIIQGKKDS